MIYQAQGVVLVLVHASAALVSFKGYIGFRVYTLGFRAQLLLLLFRLVGPTETL